MPKTLGELMPGLMLKREAIKRDAIEVAQAMKERIKAIKDERKPGQMSYNAYMEDARRQMKDLDAELNKCAQAPNQMALDV